MNKDKPKIDVATDEEINAGTDDHIPPTQGKTEEKVENAPQKDEFTYEHLKETAVTVNGLPKINNGYLKKEFDPLLRLSKKEKNIFAQKSITELTKNAFSDMQKDIIEYNSKLAEIQHRMGEIELLEKINTATPEQQQNIIRIIVLLGTKGNEHQRLKAQGSNNKAGKVEQEMNKIIEETKDDVLVTVVTQIFPVLVEIEGEGVKMIDKHIKQVANILVSYGDNDKTEVDTLGSTQA